MKKFLKALTALFSVVTMLFFVSCGGETTFYEYDQAVKIEVDCTEEMTLKEYMDTLVTSGELEYTMSGGMIWSINGVENTDKYWMIYTDDMQSVNKAYGVKYEGDNYYSALLGADSLIVKDGAVYVWIYQGF